MAEKDDQRQEGAFKITDRRKFTMDGELRPGAETEPAAPAPSKAASPPKPEPPRAPAGPAAPSASSAARPSAPSPAPAAPSARSAAGPSAPPLDEEREETGVETPFERLVVSFTSTAMMQLGLVAMDPGQPLEPDLLGARETIDMLGVLEEKTRGNLTDREARLLKNALAELRMAFVEMQRRQG